MKYLIGLVVILLIGGGVLFVINRDKASAANANANIQTGKVERRNIEKTVTANGKVASNRDVDIKCQASGKVINLPFDISNRVKTGDLLLELDPIDQQRSYDQAKAQLDASKARFEQAGFNYRVAELNLETTTLKVEADLLSAQARFNDAKAKARRAEDLYKQEFASKEELETVQTSAMQAESAVKNAEAAKSELQQQSISLKTKKQDITTAQAVVDQDTAKFKLAETQVSYCKVYVPSDDASQTADYRISSLGTATSPVQVGTVVQSGSSGFSGGTTVMTLSDVSHMFVLASVDESDLGLISDPAWGGERQRATITVDAYQGMRFEGEVVRVATKGVNTSNIVTFEVKIEITSPNKTLLRPEMTATAKVICDARQEVLTIPVAAFVPQGAGEGSQTRPARNNDSAPAGGATTAPAVADAGSTPTPPATNPSGRGRGRGRGRGGMGGGMAMIGAGGVLRSEPMNGTVNLLKSDGSQEPKSVRVGISDGEVYELLSGLEDGDTVVLNRATAQSRWRQGGGGGPGGGIMPRGMGGGGGGGRGGGGGGR